MDDFRSVHNDDVRHFAAGAPAEEAPRPFHGTAQAAAIAVGLLLLALAVPALGSALHPPAPRPAPTAPTVPTAAVAATAPPIAPTAAPAAEALAGPAYGLLDHQVAAGWTPAARDLAVGQQLYRPLDERQGASCRIRIITGQAADGQVQTADVWVDCQEINQ